MKKTISKSARMYWNSGVQHFGTVEHNYDSREDAAFNIL